MASLSVYLAAFIFLLSGRGDCIEWRKDLPDGQHVFACVGSDVSLPWTFSKEEDDSILAMEWFFEGRSEEMIGFFSHDIFVPLPAFSDRVQRTTNGGLTLRNVTALDSGNYTVEVNGRDASGASFTSSRTVFLYVSDGFVTSDKQLHMTQSPRTVYDDVTSQWSLQLSCGHFPFVGQPPFPLEWITPSGERYDGTGYHDNQFYFLVPNPAQSGRYTCRVPDNWTSQACLSPGHPVEANLTLDSVDTRLMLMDAELRSLREQHQRSAHNMTDVQQENLRLAQRVADVEQENQRLAQMLSGNKETFAIAANNIVSFHAQASADQHFADTDIIILSTVYNNDGNAYDPATGLFTAPHNGTYFFIASTGSFSTLFDANMLLMMDSFRAGAAYAHRIDTRYSETATCHAVVSLTQGQRVWLESAGQGNFNYVSTYFSGFLISR